MTKKISRLAEAIIETADDMQRLGILNQGTHEKIALRHLGAHELSTDIVVALPERCATI